MSANTGGTDLSSKNGKVLHDHDINFAGEAKIGIVGTDKDGRVPNLKPLYPRAAVTIPAEDPFVLDLSTSTHFVVAVSRNVLAADWSITNVPATGKAAEITVILVQGDDYTVAYPTSFKWSNAATAPVLDATAGSALVVNAVTVDGGTTWYVK